MIIEIHARSQRKRVDAPAAFCSPWNAVSIPGAFVKIADVRGYISWFATTRIRLPFVDLVLSSFSIIASSSIMATAGGGVERKCESPCIHDRACEYPRMRWRVVKGMRSAFSPISKCVRHQDGVGKAFDNDSSLRLISDLAALSL